MPSCQKCQAEFQIHDDEHAFLKKITFKFGDKSYNPPEPIYCPECRMVIRTCHRKEWNFHKNKCAITGKDLISLYATEPLWGKPYTVYAEDIWVGDDLDPMKYGREFNFSCSFFEQFAELLKDVPRRSMCTVDNQNSEFTTGAGYCKNCYLINSSENCEDCYYGKLFQDCSDCIDCSYIYNCELCYESFFLQRCYHCLYLLHSQNCQDCHFSTNLNACKNCCLCSNLHQKEYHFRNEPLSKEEYEAKVKEFMGSHEKMNKMREELMEIYETQVHKYSNIANSKNCTGDHIENSKNCFDCYDMTESEDCKYVQVGFQVKDNYDCSNMYIKPELCYEVLGTIEVFNCAYSIFVFNSQNMLYCDYCYHCNDCFGCSGLTRKKFCIFNKQYTEEEYNELVPKIIEHMKANNEWGKFFLPEYAPFGYNESVAQEYVPLTKEEAKEKGYLWRELKDDIPKVEKTIPADQLPDRVEDIPDDVLNWAITSQKSGRPYQILKPELAFYRGQNLPLPRLHPDERYSRRLELRNPRKLWDRKCDKCEKEVSSTYHPSRSEKIYCEQCYLTEIY